MSERVSIRRVLLALLVIALAGVGVFLIAVVIIIRGFSGTAVLPESAAESGEQCAIVFGAAVRTLFGSNGKPIGAQAGPGIARRMETAINLYKRGLITKLFLTGGKGEGMKESEASVMRQLAMRDGVNPEDIVIEDTSTSTRENLLFTEPLTGSCTTVTGVSDRYHLARIAFLARQMGWEELETFPAQVVSRGPFEVRSVIREALGILFYAIAGKLLD
ncbi:MAG: YdcF family protein [Candidatus Peregrinibacteria bacterium]|nr:YdcF family protein [Candidatus Peregrinibacteria bacterium]